jgi:hypothetical protein
LTSDDPVRARFRAAEAEADAEDALDRLRVLEGEVDGLTSAKAVAFAEKARLEEVRQMVHGVTIQV